MSWITAAAIVGGAAISANAASGAAEDQANATDAATAEQRRQYDLTRQDLAPYRDAGSAGLMELRELMGLAPSSLSLPRSGTYAGKPFSTPAELRAVMNYDTADTVTKGQIDAQVHQIFSGPDGSLNLQAWEQANPGWGGTLTVDAPTQTAPTGGPDDPYQMFGDSPLMRRFTMADFMADPVNQASFKFGMDEGTKHLRRGTPGMRNSGSMLKALTKFGSDYAGQKAGESYGRFVGDQGNVYNRLAGITGTGQNAVNTGVGAGQNTAGTISGLIAAGGDARAASRMAGANAITGGINTGVNLYNQNQILNRILGGGGYGTPSGGYYSGGV